MRHIVAALLAVFSPLAAAAKDKPADAPRVVACEPQPHMIVNDKNGRPQTAIFFCYRDDSVVIHTERALSFDEILGLIAPKPGAAPAAPVQPGVLPANVTKALRPAKNAAAVARQKASVEATTKAASPAPAAPKAPEAAPAKPAA